MGLDELLASAFKLFLLAGCAGWAASVWEMKRTTHGPPGTGPVAVVMFAALITVFMEYGIPFLVR